MIQDGNLTSSVALPLLPTAAQRSAAQQSAAQRSAAQRSRAQRSAAARLRSRATKGFARAGARARLVAACRSSSAPCSGVEPTSLACRSVLGHGAAARDVAGGARRSLNTARLGRSGAWGLGSGLRLRCRGVHVRRGSRACTLRLGTRPLAPTCPARPCLPCSGSLHNRRRNASKTERTARPDRDARLRSGSLGARGSESARGRSAARAARDTHALHPRRPASSRVCSASALSSLCAQPVRTVYGGRSLHGATRQGSGLPELSCQLLSLQLVHGADPSSSLLSGFIKMSPVRGTAPRWLRPLAAVAQAAFLAAAAAAVEAAAKHRHQRRPAAAADGPQRLPGPLAPLRAVPAR